MKKSEDQALARRDFFKKAGLGLGAAGAAAVTMVAGEGEAAEVAKSDNSAGYRDSAHVKTFYELARF